MRTILRDLKDILWPEERETSLRNLVADKLTSGQIALRLGVTRNAVIGKVHRMGLKLLSTQAERTQTRPPPRRTKELRRISPKKFIVVTFRSEDKPAPQALEPIRKLNIMELEYGDCRWPLDERGKYDIRLFCGRAVAASSVYCHEHHRKAFVRR